MRENSAYTLVSLADPEEYTFAICLQDSNGTSLQLGYLAISLGFGSYLPLSFLPPLPLENDHSIRSINLFHIQ